LIRPFFIFHLHDIAQLIFAKKLKFIPTLREEGNQLYIKGDFQAAAVRYQEALNLLEQLSLREKPGDPEWVELDKQRVPFYVNLAQCQFKLKVNHPLQRSYFALDGHFPYFPKLSASLGVKRNRPSIYRLVHKFVTVVPLVFFV
uniref:TPR_REGION domain-containing protein n=1 Tax=Echinostoma caproni TaxID=27848 RepID=A0A183BGC0_9TREM